jgi:hypothetical protein
VQPRNYELEDIKFSLRAKPVRDHPLINNDGQTGQRFGGFGGAGLKFMIEKKNYDNSTAESGEESSDEENGILGKVK